MRFRCITLGLLALLALLVPLGHAFAQPESRTEEAASLVLDANGVQALPWAWVRVVAPQGWRAVETESLDSLRFERFDEAAGAVTGEVWFAALDGEGYSDAMQRIAREDVQQQLAAVSWQGWRPRAPRRVQLGGREFAELRNNEAAELRRTVALTLHAGMAVVLVIDGAEADSAWLRSATFEFVEPLDGLRGRVAFPALPQWQVPVPVGFAVERIEPRMLALRRHDGGDNGDAASRILALAFEVPQALGLNEAFGEAERTLASTMGLERLDARHLPAGRLDGLLALCSFAEGARRAWAWWGYDPASHTLLALIHEFDAGSREVAERRLTATLLPSLGKPEPSPHPALARIEQVRLVSTVTGDGGRQLAVLFLDEADRPVVFRGLAYDVRLTFANRPVPGIAEVIRGSESGDVLPEGLRAGVLALSASALSRLRDLPQQASVTLAVRLQGRVLQDEVALGVLLAP